MNGIFTSGSNYCTLYQHPEHTSNVPEHSSKCIIAYVLKNIQNTLAIVTLVHTQEKH